MADFNVKFKAADLGKSLENLAHEVEEELNQAVKDVANSAYANIMANAQAELHSSRTDYIKGLSFHDLGNNTYVIILEGEYANEIEKGYASFDVREGLLRSEKVVGVGNRAGQKWVQTGKDGQKFAHVPFEHKPYSKAAQSSDLNQAIRKLTAFNKQGREQRLTKLFKDDGGRIMQGKVASVRKVEGFPQIEGITKYQKTYKNEKTGKNSTQSIYMTYRTVSEHGEEWRHPGYAGAHFFDEAEKWIDQELDNIINTLIK